MADDTEEIDLEQIVWDPRYRRRVIEKLNRTAPREAAPSQDPAPAESKPAEPR